LQLALRSTDSNVCPRLVQANLSAFMRRLMASYALYARHRHKRPGHFVQGRFKAKLIDVER